MHARQRLINGVPKECLPIRSHYRTIAPLPAASLAVMAASCVEQGVPMVDREGGHTRSKAGKEATGSSFVPSVLRAPAQQHHLRLGVGIGYADLHRERSHSELQETRRSGASEIRYGQAKLSGRQA